MKEVYYFLIINVITIVLSSCGKATDDSPRDITAIKIPKELSYYTDSWENISDLKDVIALETSAEVSIQGIDKIICDTSRFYILDIRQKTIFIFNKDAFYSKKTGKLIVEELSFGARYNSGPLRCLCEETFVSAVEVI